MTKEKYSEYKAKYSYRDMESIIYYLNRPCYSGLLGALQKYKEKVVISKILNFIESGCTILDCPCGNGRWFKTLAKKSDSIIGIDLSENMLKVAALNGKILEYINKHVKIQKGDAEKLPLEDNSVDYIFSFALMKHLPDPIKYKVLSEFTRVCRKGIICSFALFTPIAFTRWKIKKDPESYSLWKSKLIDMVREIGLEIRAISRIMPVVGLECVVYFEKSSKR